MRSLQIYEKVGFQKCERVDEELVHREPLMNPAGNVTKDFLSNPSKLILSKKDLLRIKSTCAKAFFSLLLHHPAPTKSMRF